MHPKAINFITALLVLLILPLNVVNAETIYFLVGEIYPEGHGDSYVLPLSRPDDITHARFLILGVLQQPICIAYIEREADGINRDYFDVNKRLWHWHVTEFVEFADLTPEILDGWPSAVEEGIFEGNMIGFWAYTVVAELGTDPNLWDRDYVPDFQINQKDFAVFAQNWGNTECDNPVWCGGTDLNKNGAVDFDDLKLFAESWLTPFAPEPPWYL